MRSYELYKPVFDDYIAIIHANMIWWRHVCSINNKKNRQWNGARRKKNRLKPLNGQIFWKYAMRCACEDIESNWKLQYHLYFNIIYSYECKVDGLYGVVSTMRNISVESEFFFYGAFYVISSYSFCIVNFVTICLFAFFFGHLDNVQRTKEKKKKKTKKVVKTKNSCNVSSG